MRSRRAGALLAVLAVAAMTPLPALSASPPPASLPPFNVGPTIEPIASSNPVLALAPIATPVPNPAAPASSPASSAAPAAARTADPATPLPVRAPAPTPAPARGAEVAAVPVASPAQSPPLPSAAATGVTPGGSGDGPSFPGSVALTLLAALGLVASFLILGGRSRRAGAGRLSAEPPSGTLDDRDAPDTTAATRRARFYPADDPILTAMGLGKDEPPVPSAERPKSPRVRPGRKRVSTRSEPPQATRD